MSGLRPFPDPRLVGPLHRRLALRAITAIVDMCPVLAHAFPPQLGGFVRLFLVAARAVTPVVFPAALDLYPVPGLALCQSLARLVLC